MDELVHTRVRYSLNGENMGVVDFNSRQHVKAAVTRIAGPKGYEIHVPRRAPYEGRLEQIFTSKVRTGPHK